jgi:hypothetical protein
MGSKELFRKMVPEVNSGNEYVKSIIADLQSACIGLV